MLSVSAIGSSGKADYYAKDDYYMGSAGDGAGGAGGGGSLAGRDGAGKEPGDTQLVWGGAGAAMLGLSGQAKAIDYTAIMSGRNPNAQGPAVSRRDRAERKAAIDLGERGVANPKPELKHAPGTDLTFSAPKGVSIALLIGGDRRLLKAHTDAVEGTMAYAEANFAQVRIRDRKGGREVYQTGNLVYSHTTHNTSREGDPQLHTHTPIANMTYVAELNEWRALDNRQLVKHQQLLGKTYRALLAEKVKELGYDVRPNKGGTFELAGFTDRQLKVFSKATERVDANLARERPESPGMKDVVKRMNRPRKLEVGEATLAERWQGEALRMGLNVRSVVAEAVSKGRGQEIAPDPRNAANPIYRSFLQVREAIADRLNPMRDPYGFATGAAVKGRDLIARSAISYGLQVLEARRAVFSRHEVLGKALEVSGISVTPGHLARQLKALEGEGKVLRADLGVLAGITTSRALRTEADIIDRMKAGLGQGKPIYTVEAAVARVAPEAVIAAGHRFPMNTGQMAAAALVLSSSDRIVAIHGAAGAGKTTMFEAVNKAAAERGVELFGLTPSHSAKGALKDSAGVRSEVVSWFTARYGHLTAGRTTATPAERQAWKNTILVVDEGSLLSNADALQVLQISDKLGMQKVVLVGDTRQHNAPSAGAPFRHLINHDIPLARMEEILRQKDPLQRGAVEAFARGEPTLGVKLLSERIVEVGASKGDRSMVGAAIELWRQGKADGVERPVITQTQAQRAAFNALALEHLKATGEVQPTGDVRDRLVNVPLDGPARYRAVGYEAGQVLIFHQAHRAKGIARNEQLEIVGTISIDGANTLLARRAGGQQLTLNLNAMGRRGAVPFQLYERREGQEIMLGAKMVWERADAARGLNTGETFTPIADRGGAYEVRLQSGQTALISKTDPQLSFVGADYAITSYRAQGRTMETAPIGIAGSRGANQATVYVQASRAVHDFTLVTDSVLKLLYHLPQETGMNLSATEERARVLNRAISLGGLSNQAGQPAGDREDISQKRAPMQKSINADLPMPQRDHSL